MLNNQGERIKTDGIITALENFGEVFSLEHDGVCFYNDDVEDFDAHALQALEAVKLVHPKVSIKKYPTLQATIGNLRDKFPLFDWTQTDEDWMKQAEAPTCCTPCTSTSTVWTRVGKVEWLEGGAGFTSSTLEVVREPGSRVEASPSPALVMSSSPSSTGRSTCPAGRAR